MSLEFRPPYQVTSPQENRAQQLARLNQTISGIGQNWAQNAKEAALMKLQKAKEDREAAQFRMEYGDQSPYGATQPTTPSPLDLGRQPWASSPSYGAASQPSPMGPQPSASLSQGSMGPQPTVGQPNYSSSDGSSMYMPPNTDYSPQGQPMSMAPLSNQPQSVDHTSHFMAWRNMGMPSSYDHSDYGGMGINVPGSSSGPAFPQGSPYPMRSPSMAPNSPGARLGASDPSLEEYQRLGARGFIQKYGTKGLDKLKTTTDINKSLEATKFEGYTPEQAGEALYPDDPEKAMAKANRLRQLYGEQIPKEVLGTMRGGMSLSLNQGTKTGQFDTKQWNIIEHRTNPINAPRGSGLGQAGINNMRADRALKTLADPNATDKQLAAATIDFAGIMHGGAPDELEIKNQMYGTLQTKWNNFLTEITSTPQAARQPEVQAKLRQMVSDIKEVDNKAINDNLDEIEIAFADTIDKAPERWKKYRAKVTGTTVPLPGTDFGGSAGGGAGGVGGAKPMYAVNKATRQRIQSLDGGKTWQPAQ